jgi:hypothetical protein
MDITLHKIRLRDRKFLSQNWSESLAKSDTAWENWSDETKIGSATVRVNGALPMGRISYSVCSLAHCLQVSLEPTQMDNLNSTLGRAPVLTRKHNTRLERFAKEKDNSFP